MARAWSRSPRRSGNGSPHSAPVLNSPVTPVTRLGLARAYALAGDKDKSRTAYQDFLGLWKNADPDVRADLLAFFRRLVPEGAPYLHQDEGADDMPAHIKSALTQTQLTIPVADGAPVLGTWQGIYLFEHRAAPHRRELVLHLLFD